MPVEKSYSLHEIAKLLKLSPARIERMIKDEPGVFKLETVKGKRQRLMYRVSASTIERILDRYRNPAV